MFIEYTGRKKPLHMTRPEQEKEYRFLGGPVEVTQADGEFFLQYPSVFKRVAKPKVKISMEQFVATVFPGKTIKGLNKNEIEKKCLLLTDGKTNLNKTKSVVNMLKEFMEAV